VKTRIIYTKFWHDNYVSELNSKEKLVFIYLITNSSVNICGIYELPDRYIRFDLELKQSELDKIKQKFMKDNKIMFINGWVKIMNYEIYNKFTGEKNEKAKEKELSLIPDFIIGYRWGIDGVSTNGDTLNNINQNINQNKLVINNKNGNGKKDIYMEVVKLTKDEYNKLIDELGEKRTKQYIEELAYYMQSQGKENKYKNHYATIMAWYRKNIKEGKLKKLSEPNLPPLLK